MLRLPDDPIPDGSRRVLDGYTGTSKYKLIGINIDNIMFNIDNIMLTRIGYYWKLNGRSFHSHGLNPGFRTMKP